VRRMLAVAGAVVGLLAGLAPPASAQSFILNSAETINRGNVKISAFPTVLLGDDGAPNSWGVATRLGYGFTDWFDVEGKVGFFDGLNLYGADAEAWIFRGDVDISLSLGGHLADVGAGSSSKAVDVAGLLSGHVSPWLEVYGGVSLSFESLDDSDHDFTRAYVVPGVEIRITRQLDFLAEYGLGLNDDSPNYVGFGLAFYVKDTGRPARSSLR